MSEGELADEFMGHGPPPAPAVPRPDAGGTYTLSGEARNVRPFTEEIGWGEHRQTIQVVSFTLDQFASGALVRSVYAEMRGRTIVRRPVENESVTVTGRFVGRRFEVHTLAGLRDDPQLPLHAPAPPRPRRGLLGLLPLGCAALIMLFVCGVPLGIIGFVATIGGRGSEEPLGEAPGAPPAAEAPSAAAPSPHVQSATGPGPWVIAGQGYRYEIVSASRITVKSWPDKPTPALIVRGFVTRTDRLDLTTMDWELRNQDNVKLARTGQGAEDLTAWERAPTLQQRLPITLTVYDSTPEATRLTLTVSDFFRAQEGLILHDIPVT